MSILVNILVNGEWESVQIGILVSGVLAVECLMIMIMIITNGCSGGNSEAVSWIYIYIYIFIYGYCMSG